MDLALSIPSSIPFAQLIAVTEILHVALFIFYLSLSCVFLILVDEAESAREKWTLH